MHQILIVSVLAATAMAPCRASQDLGAQELGGRILGEGTDRPIAGAILSLLTSDLEQVAATVSDSTGWYRLEAPTAGDYIVTVESMGFVNLQSPLIRVDVDRPVSLGFRMDAAPLELPGLNVNVEQQEAARLERLRLEATLTGVRLDDLGARFIDESFIRSRWASRDISEVIEWRALPGIKVYSRRGGSPPCVSLLRARTGGGRDTCASVAVNGQIASMEMLLLLPLDGIEAVMILLPSEASLTFGSRAGFGVVNIITKVRGR